MYIYGPVCRVLRAPFSNIHSNLKLDLRVPIFSPFSKTSYFRDFSVNVCAFLVIIN